MLRVDVALLLAVLLACGGVDNHRQNSDQTSQPQAAAQQAQEQQSKAPTPIKPTVSEQNVDFAASVFERVTRDGFDGVIVTGEQFHSAEGWTPTLDQVLTMESALRDYVMAESPSHRVRDELHHYKRQYWGLFSGKRNEIVTVFYHESTRIVVEGKWLKSIVGVAGGGDFYFQTRYDVRSGRFTRLSINAPE